MRGMARGYAAGDSRGPGWREIAGTLGQLQAGRQAGEWNGLQPGQGAAEGFPRPAPGEMQSEAARSHQSEDPPPEGLGDHGPLAQHPRLQRARRRALIEGARGIFGADQDGDRKAEEALIAQLYQHIGQLKVERDFLNGKLGA